MDQLIQNSLPNDSDVYRAVHVTQFQAGRRIPSDSNFRPDADGLSVYWDKFSTPRSALFYIGLSFKKE